MSIDALVVFAAPAALLLVAIANFAQRALGLMSQDTTSEGQVTAGYVACSMATFFMTFFASNENLRFDYRIWIGITCAAWIALAFFIVPVALIANRVCRLKLRNGLVFSAAVLSLVPIYVRNADRAENSSVFSYFTHTSIREAIYILMFFEAVAVSFALGVWYASLVKRN